MNHAAKILADSIAPNGCRLTTMEVVFPRIVLAEFNTHRMFSRNSASSRAIPIEKMVRMVRENPYVPSDWGANQKGMQAGEPLTPEKQEAARVVWLQARDVAIEHALTLLDVGLHKQITNRLLEPFMWHTAIVSATHWKNFFDLRCSPMTHPDLRATALLMRDAMAASTPRKITYGEWHMPLVFEDDYEEPVNDPEDSLKKASIGRCARVSYLTHDGKRDISADIELCNRLLKDRHMSPLEHVATPADGDKFYGNFQGWKQFRKFVPNESGEA